MVVRAWQRTLVALVVAVVGLVTVRAAQADGFGPEALWGSNLCTSSSDLCAVGDFDGDGKDDVVRFASNGNVDIATSDVASFRAPSTWITNFAPPSKVPRVGDFNGDGKSDIAISDTTTKVALSTGSTFSTPTQWSPYPSWGPYSVARFCGNVDSQAADDLITIDNDGYVGVWKSNGSNAFTFSPWHEWETWFEGTPRWRLGNVDNDADADLVKFLNNSTGDVKVALSNGSTAFVPQASNWHEFFAPTNEVPELGDFNGDGRIDIVTFVKQGTRDVSIALAQTSGGFGSSSLQHDNTFCDNSDQCLTGDFNGDGKADLVAFVTQTAGTHTAGQAYVSLRQKCGVTTQVGSSCADNLCCNGPETCHSDYTCRSDTSPLEDNNPCTADTCSESNCLGVHTPINPADSNPCTIDYCTAASGIQHVPVAVGTACSDGNPCNGNETCTASGTCETTSSPNYDDGNPCTIDACSPTAGVTHTTASNGSSCSDGDACNGAETCQNAACTPGTPPSPPQACRICTTDPRDGTPVWATLAPVGTSCTDANACTTGDACNAAGNCTGTNVPSGTVCATSPCNTCNGSGSCTGGAPTGLDDANPCTADSCDLVLGVVHAPLARGQTPGCASPNACDGAGRCTTTGTSAPEPDESVLDNGIATPFASSTEFLYDTCAGCEPIQTISGGGSVALDSKRVGVIRGRVLGRDSIAGGGAELALPNVKVTVLGKDQVWGQTLTRDDGKFDFAVEGGGPVTMVFERTNYFTAHRIVTAPWNDYELIDDVVLVEKDPNFETALVSTPGSGVTVVEGTATTEYSETRQGTLIVPQDTTAKINGNTVTSLTLRVTEFTVGPNGPEAMPAPLPPNSAYTYAVELSADEAPGNANVTFEGSKPAFYVENFLGFAVGQNVPVGSYDRPSAKWKAEPSGRVVKIINCTGGACCPAGTVGLDSDGDTDADCADITLSDGERGALTAKYTAGKTLWRVEVSHFTPWDCNWPYGPPPPPGGPGGGDDGGGPNGGGPPGDCAGGHSGGGAGPGPTTAEGSIIECETQVLGESLPVAGTPYTLNYRSSRTTGSVEPRTIRFRLPGTNKSERKRFEARLQVAGQEVAKQTFAASEFGKELTWTWDGLDAYARRVNGQAKAKLIIDEFYPPHYYEASEFAQFSSTFNLGATTVAATNRTEIVVRREWTRNLGVFDASGQEVGDWTLSEVHSYDPNARVLYLGDGKTVSSGAEGVVWFAAALEYPASIAAGPDGSLYVTTDDAEVLRITPAGALEPFAGTGWLGTGCEGCLAASVNIGRSMGVAVGPDSTVYFTDWDNDKIWRVVNEQGQNRLYTVAGTGTAGFADGLINGPTPPKFNDPWGIAAAPDGTLYVADEDNHRVRKIDPARTKVTTIAGTGNPASWPCPLVDSNGNWTASGDSNYGEPTTTAAHGTRLASQMRMHFPRYVAVAPDGTVLIGGSTNGLFAVGNDGALRLIAGNGAGNGASPYGCELPGDGGPALLASWGYTHGIAVGPDGSIYVGAYATGGLGSGLWQRRIRRIDPTGIIQTIAGNDNVSGGSSNLREGVAALATTFGSVFGLALAPNGALYTAEWGDFKVRRIVPSLPGRPPTGGLTVQSPNGRELFVFDANGRHLETKDAWTNQTIRTIGRDAAQRVTSVTETNVGVPGTPTASTTDIIRDATSGVPLRIEAPFDQKTTFTLANGHLSTVTYTGLNSDDVGGDDVVTLTHASNGLLQQMVDARGFTHIFKYDSLGRLIEDIDPAGGKQLLSRPAPQPDGGYVVERTDGAGHKSTYKVETIASGGQKRTVINPDNTQTVTEIFADGKTKITLPDATIVETSAGSDPLLGPQVGFGSSEKTTLAPGTGDQKVKQVTRTRAKDPAAGVTWQQTTTLDPTPGINAQTIIDFSASANSYTLTSPEGRTVTQFFDSGGRLLKVVRPGILDVVYEYEARGRLAKTSRGPAPGTRVHNLTYHSQVTGDPKSGYLASTAPPAPLTDSTTFTQDALGRVLTEAVAGNTTQFKWTASGDLRAVTPPGKPSHTLNYSPVDRLSAYTPPDVSTGIETTFYEHFPNRELKSETRPDGIALTRAYEPGLTGRLDTLTQTGLGMLDYGYDSAGRVSSLNGPGGVNLAFTYIGHLPKTVTWSGDVAGSLTWNYDTLFRATTEVLSPPGTTSTIYYRYDKDGLLVCASGAACPSSKPASPLTAKLGWYSYDYDYPGPPTPDKNGLLREVEVGGSKETLTYNAYGEPATQTVVVGGTTMMTIGYESVARDVLGRVVKQTETLQGQTTTWEYAYDGSGRLEKVWKNVANTEPPTNHYAYDANGNRLTVTGAIPPTTPIASYDSHDRLEWYDFTPGTRTYFTYGLNGELKTKTTGSQTTSYQYDGLGNLRTVGLPNGDTIEYFVDGFGRRVGKRRKLAGQGTWAIEKRWLYKDRLEPVAEIDASGNVTRFVYGSRRHVPDFMITPADSVYRLVVDQLGSVRLVVNVTNPTDVLQRLDYDPWGVPTLALGGSWTAQPFGFAGGMYDHETGFARFGARDYYAASGRWVAKDPIRFDGTLTNLYSYVDSDPINLIDLNGNYVIGPGLGLIALSLALWGEDIMDAIFGSGCENAYRPNPTKCELDLNNPTSPHPGDSKTLKFCNYRCLDGYEFSVQISINEPCEFNYRDIRR